MLAIMASTSARVTFMVAVGGEYEPSFCLTHPTGTERGFVILFLWLVGSHFLNDLLAEEDDHGVEVLTVFFSDTDSDRELRLDADAEVFAIATRKTFGAANINEILFASHGFTGNFESEIFIRLDVHLSTGTSSSETRAALSNLV
jgi:hypothetical protein